MAITFEGNLEEVDDIAEVSFKTIMGLRRYLVVFLVKRSIGIYFAAVYAGTEMK